MGRGQRRRSDVPASAQRFRLAPMDNLNVGLTALVVATVGTIGLTALMNGLFLTIEEVGHELLIRVGLLARPDHAVFTGIGLAVLAFGLFLCGILGSILVYYRPRYFEISGRGLRIVWPIRRRTYPLSSITGAELYDWQGFRRVYGRGGRIGAGGFLGAFGFRPSKRGLLSMYISRFEPVLVVTFTRARPLLISPERPTEFLDELRQRFNEAGQVWQTPPSP